MPDDDSFWNDELNFTKQTCFANYQGGTNKGVVKKWITDETLKPFFGKGYARLLNRWKKDNQPLVNLFCSEIRKIL